MFSYLQAMTSDVVRFSDPPENAGCVAIVKRQGDGLGR